MARKSAPTISQDELYPPPDEYAQADLDDARLLDLDTEEESPFLRGQKRVSARRSPLPIKTANRLKWIMLGLILLGVAAIASGEIYRYTEHSWRFRVQSSDDIEISGNHNVTRAQVMEVMGGDIGRNIFFVSLAQRKAQLEQIPWVEYASVMRFIPNRLKVEIHERTPVAFARIGSRISLTDAGGTLMDLPAGNKTKYSFPVIIGISGGEPHSTRAARMKIYSDLVHELDSGGGRYSQELSEVDLSDLDDVKVLANDPQGAVLVHLGSANFLDRYKIYVAHVREWRQQFAKLESVDLRYDRQIIVNPDLREAPKQAPLSAKTARVAAAAGVKPAALISHGAAPVAKAKMIGPPPPPKPAKAAEKSKPAKARAKAHAPAKTHRRSATRTSVLHKPTAPKAKAQPVPASSASVGAGPKPKKPSAAIAKDPVKQ
jgi:cell division protein FtsQ